MSYSIKTQIKISHNGSFETGTWQDWVDAIKEVIRFAAAVELLQGDAPSYQNSMLHNLLADYATGSRAMAEMVLQVADDISDDQPDFPKVVDGKFYDAMFYELGLDS